MKEFETLSVTMDQKVALVELNRPDKMNSINAAMWQELEDCFLWANQEPQVRAIVLAGKGRHFCSGIDLAMFGDLLKDASASEARRAEQLRLIIKRLQGNLTAIENCRKPVLGAIHKGCIGGGVDMTCCCDMRYCTEDAFFTIKEIDIGMTADVGTLQRLPRLIGEGVVREMAYTGRNVDAQEAFQVGLVNKVYKDREEMIAGVMTIAQNIAQKSPLAIRGIKEMLLYTRDHSVEDGLNYIATWNAGMLSMEDIMKTLEAQGAKLVPDYDD